MGLSQNAFPLLSPDGFVEEDRGDRVSGDARAGCSHGGGGLIPGPAPFLLGKTWIWPEVSSYLFAAA